MILRRITEHIKAQNWFAVSLDFLIVVVGILIAFQVNTWSERQADKQALNVALQRLHDEIGQNLAAIEDYSGRHDNIIAAGEALLDLVNDPSLDEVPTDLIAKVFLDGYSTDYSTSALTSVLNQQSFKGLQRTGLRPAISALPAEYLDAMEDELIVIELLDTRWIPYITQKLPAGPLWASAYKSTEWETYFASMDDLSINISASVTEFKELASSLEFKNNIINRIGYERLIKTEQDELRIILQETLALIEAEIQ